MAHVERVDAKRDRFIVRCEHGCTPAVDGRVDQPYDVEANAERAANAHDAQYHPAPPPSSAPAPTPKPEPAPPEPAPPAPEPEPEEGPTTGPEDGLTTPDPDDEPVGDAG